MLCLSVGALFLLPRTVWLPQRLRRFYFFNRMHESRVSICIVSGDGARRPATLSEFGTSVGGRRHGVAGGRAAGRVSCGVTAPSRLS